MHKYLLPSFFTMLLTGCMFGPSIPENHYNLEECKEEILNAKDYSLDSPIDKIIVTKENRKMYLYYKEEIKDILPISLGKNPKGHKVQRGDFRTPEGEFFIHRKLCSKKYYRSLCISYPRKNDIKAARKKGLNPGGDITIHAQPKWNADGNGDSYTLTKDWTEGCVAITNESMDRLWYAVREGVPIIIK